VKGYEKSKFSYLKAEVLNKISEGNGNDEGQK